MADNEPAVPRLSARVFFQDLAEELFSLDRGIPYTLWQLLTRPGSTTRRYIETRDRRLTKPFRLALLSLALVLVFGESNVVDFGHGLLVGLTGADEAGQAGRSASVVSATVAQLNAYLHLALIACWVPVVAAAMQRSHGRWGLNSAEAFVFGLYTLPQTLIWLLPWQIWTSMAEPTPTSILVAAVLAMAPVALSAHGYARPEGASILRALWCVLLSVLFLPFMFLGVVVGLAALNFLLH